VSAKFGMQIPFFLERRRGKFEKSKPLEQYFDLGKRKSKKIFFLFL
jgi:hypothetical protein